MRALKATLIIISCLILVSGMMAADVSARIEGRWILQAGDVVAGEDISLTKISSSLFHQQTADISDLENLDIDFPISANSLELGPTVFKDGAVDGAASLKSSNVLPFGPVNLAFPDVHEDVTQAANTSSTGFFTANWCYMADTATANLGAEPLGIYMGSGHPIKSSRMLGSEFIWPLMVPIPKATASAGSLMLDVNDLAMPIESILSKAPVSHKPKISFSTYGNNTTMNTSVIQANNTAVRNNTSQVGNASKPPTARTPTRKPRVNAKATKAEINNMTLLPRMYRNAFGGTTMHMAFEGPVTYPTWINPYNNGTGVFNVVDKQKANQLGMNKTRQGAHIAPVFWDL